MSCSVVVPVHNESVNIEAFVREFRDSLGDLVNEVREVILVENGSTDETFDTISSLSDAMPGFVRADRIPEASYGLAVKRGILEANYEWICILECDVMDVDFVRAACMQLAEKEADFVVASKRHPDSVDSRPFKRRALTYLFNTYLKYRLGFVGTDTHGLKAMKAEVGKRLADICITSGEVLQTELVLLAERLGYKVVEIPLRLEERRSPAISIRKRFPKVMRMVGELKQSLARFPEEHP